MSEATAGKEKGKHELKCELVRGRLERLPNAEGEGAMRSHDDQAREGGVPGPTGGVVRFRRAGWKINTKIKNKVDLLIIGDAG